MDSCTVPIGYLAPKAGWPVPPALSRVYATASAANNPAVSMEHLVLSSHLFVIYIYPVVTVLVQYCLQFGDKLDIQTDK